MKFLKINVHAIPLGLIVESELIIWVNVVALIVARSDYKPILTTVYGQQTKLDASEYVKIAEVATGGACTYKLKFLSAANHARPALLFSADLSFEAQVALSLDLFSSPNSTIVP